LRLGATSARRTAGHAPDRYTTLRNLKPSHKTRKATDSKGLYIEIAPSGGKWWRLKYRIGGKEKRLSLAVYPEVSLKDARERRDDARKLLAKGSILVTTERP
jgi:hypothetical protein